TEVWHRAPISSSERRPDKMSTIALKGCAPIPLAYYLKGLGTLRLVAEQVDPAAEGHWGQECFYLTSILNEESLMRFLLDSYQPTPILAPWNGGSGFYKKDDQTALLSIQQGTAERFASYRDGITAAKRAVADCGLS